MPNPTEAVCNWIDEQPEGALTRSQGLEHLVNRNQAVRAGEGSCGFVRNDSNSCGKVRNPAPTADNPASSASAWSPTKRIRLNASSISICGIEPASASTHPTFDQAVMNRSGNARRARLALEYASREELLACLKHLLASAGNPSLMTPELMHTVCDHAMGNYRALTTMAGELLAAAAQRELTQLDEKLYLEVFTPPGQSAGKRRARIAGA